MVEGRNFGLDLSRALAILAVIASHYANNSLNRLGFWGVELFFSLSGFLIGNILWRSFSGSTDWNHVYLMNFWSRRWWRTLPNYYLFLGVALFYSFLTEHTVVPMTTLVRYLFFGQFLVSKTSGFYELSWSLCVEEWFYLSFPLILVGIQILKLSRKKTFFLAIITVFSVSFAVKLFLYHTNSEILQRQITFSRLDAIGCGVLIAFLISAFPVRRQYLRPLFIAGLIFICAPLLSVFFNKILFKFIWENFFCLTLVPFGFALCLPYISKLEVINKIPGFVISAIQKISLYSYSVYLSHVYILFAIYYLFEKIRSGSPLGNLLSKIVALIATFLVSYLIFRFIETPFTAMRPRELKSKVPVNLIPQSVDAVKA